MVNDLSARDNEMGDLPTIYRASRIGRASEHRPASLKAAASAITIA
jgi:hypothetical protein